MWGAKTCRKSGLVNAYLSTTQLYKTPLEKLLKFDGNPRREKIENKLGKK